jgi:putative oxidoreductase
MNTHKMAPLFSTSLRLLVAGIFIVAAVLKMHDPAAFAEQIANYRLWPSLSNYLAVGLPGIELMAAAVLLFGRRLWRTGALLILAGLLVVFTVAIARAWAMGLDLDCGCFGTGSTHVGPWSVLRNLGLLAALGTSFWLERRARRDF